ncbi:MAG: hypothetical protein AAF387_06595 [Pseudomonadota bacterium]
MSDSNFVRYINRSREYYEAQGFDKPYRWFEAEGVPFTPLSKPLANCRATIVTTAMPDNTYTPETRRLHIGQIASAPENFSTEYLFWDRDATNTDDRETYFPLKQLEKSVNNTEIGSIAEHYYCVPTNYSYRETINRDAPNIVEQCIKDKVDVALLVPL